MNPCPYLSRISLIVLAVLASCVFAQGLRAQNPSLTIANPTPALGEMFGHQVAAVGNNLLIADPRDNDTAGTVSLYSASGARLHTFTNPAPTVGSHFGWALAAFGPDHVLIGAPLSSPPPAGLPGAAFLFHTNGALLRTFVRPTPQAGAGFGISVAAVGHDRVLIGASADDLAATDGGAVYLFHTNGTLLATITNNLPAANQAFGSALAVLGNDRLLIGAPGGFGGVPGTACLFTTNGTLLRRFTDPNGLVDSWFGATLAVLGTDRLVIGALNANVEAPAAGAANIFSTNGLILSPLFNPEPDAYDQFGLSIAVVGSDKILVGCSDQRTAPYAGGAYLFSTNGALMMTISKPMVEGAQLGKSVAALGADRVLIGANNVNYSGAAYVFDLQPSLGILNTETNTVVVSWPSGWNGWALQENTNLQHNVWSSALENVTDNGVDKFITANPATGHRFYRLLKP